MNERRTENPAEKKKTQIITKSEQINQSSSSSVSHESRKSKQSVGSCSLTLIDEVCGSFSTNVCRIRLIGGEFRPAVEASGTPELNCLDGCQSTEETAPRWL